jgi:sugar/nucleoside kinase (ribokinase family)
MKLDAVGCGSMVVDLFHRTPRLIGAEEKILLDSGSTRRSGAVQSAVGGVVLNHLGWARVLGLNVGIFGKLGNDAHAAFLRRGMRQAGIRRHLSNDGSASSTAAIFVDPAGSRAIYMIRGATGELSAAEVRRKHAGFIRNSHIVTTEISQLPLSTVIAILSIARAATIPTVLDVDVPPSDACATIGTRRQLEQALRLATILKPSKAAARELMNGRAGADSLALATTLRDRYHCRAVIITDGDRGCAISSAEAALRVPAFRVRQVDSTGAGDAFMGALIAGLRWGLDWAAIGRLANAAGARCVTRLGAFPAGLGLRKEIQRLYGDKLPNLRKHP